ncbi:EGF-like domain-containing protein 2 [Crassostrea virginica]|uniref:EGF-like domain-containing protein 2 n=1 Tax=Crassostrea virginica TaxID=6565 RepID=A0A8B8BEP1_CRAVI|nr:EGF-like domain-containing protein 2 [Crassostrea virginica]
MKFTGHFGYSTNYRRDQRPTMSAISLLVFLACVSYGLGYNCLNTGYDCKNGGACDYFGRCKCPPGFGEVDCGLDTASITPAASCRASCLNNGICFNGISCYCPEDYMGTKCEVPVLNAECGMTSMKIRAYRPLNFNGEMFLKQSMFGCKLTEMFTNVAGYKMYELDIPLQSISPCSLKKTENPETGDIVYEVDVATAHTKGFFSMSDTVHNVKCVYQARRLGENPVDVTQQMNPVSLKVVDSNERPLQQVARNDAFYILAESTGKIPNANGARIRYLEAYSLDRQTNEVKSIKLIEDECPIESAVSLLGFTPSNVPFELNGKWLGRVEMKGFLLVDGEPLFIDYRAKLCRSKCYEKSCNSPPPLTIPKTAPFKDLVNPIEVV